MVTINPATILRWQTRLGSIERKKWADLVVITGQTKDPYLQLVEARETSVALVVTDGVPRVGRPYEVFPLPAVTGRTAGPLAHTGASSTTARRRTRRRMGAWSSVSGRTRRDSAPAAVTRKSRRYTEPAP
jgi:hypothetical protein